MTASRQPAAKRQSPTLSLPVNQRLQKGLELLKAHIAEHGWEDVRGTTRLGTFHLGQWVSMRRMQYRRGTLPTWLAKELAAIPGWSWDPRKDEQLHKLKLLRRYIRQHGWDRLTCNTVVDGVRLGPWVTARKRAYAAGKLPEWLQTELEAIPGWFDSLPPDNGLTIKEQAAMDTLRQFVADCGWGKLESFTKVDDVHIGRFVRQWRLAHRRSQLDPRIAEQLETIPGWSWESTYLREKHLRSLALLREYVAEHGWQQVRRSIRVQDVNLHGWCDSRRSDYRKGKLADWLRRELEAIPGWRWRTKDHDPSTASKSQTRAPGS